MTSRPSRLAISTVSSFDTSSTRIMWSTRSCGMSAYVRSSVRAALYAGMTMTTLGSLGHVRNSTRSRRCHDPRVWFLRTGRCRPRAPRRARETSMFDRLFGDRRPDPAVADRVPPGQYLTEKFPVLHYGSVPKVDLATWDFRVYGEVDSPFALHLGRVPGPAAQAGDDRHPLRDPLVEAGHALGRRRDPDDPGAGAGPPQRHARRSATRSRATPPTCRSSVLDDDDVLLADTYEGEPLTPDHGYPLRLIVPKQLLLEGPEVDPRPGVPGPRPAGLLGALRLPQRRGPLAGGAVQRVG